MNARLVFDVFNHLANAIAASQNDIWIYHMNLILIDSEPFADDYKMIKGKIDENTWRFHIFAWVWLIVAMVKMVFRYYNVQIKLIETPTELISFFFPAF